MNDTLQPDDNDKNKKPDDMTKIKEVPSQAEMLLKPSKEPTVDEMRLFCSLYRPEEWVILTKSSEFCLAVTQNLQRARVMAGKMLKN
jgi:hypothetical protein